MNSKHACIVILAFWTLFSWSVFADVHSKLIKQKADQTNQALVRGDYGTVADLTHPKLVQLMGGREKMISTMKATLSEMKTHGVQFKSATIDNPTDVVSKNGQLFAIVPFSLSVSIPQGIATQKSYLIASSSDKGRTWTFVDGGNVDTRTLKDVLPNLPPTLKLPEKQAPVLQKEAK